MGKIELKTLNKLDPKH